MRASHDPDLVDALLGMPYVRCVTGKIGDGGALREREVVVTSLTEGHRIASDYFLAGEVLISDTPRKPEAKKLRDEAKRLKDGVKSGGDEGEKKAREKEAKEKVERAKEIEDEATFERRLARDFGLELANSKKAHPPFAKWWDVFKAIFKYDPNALVHGVLFTKWQVKIPRVLTAHLEAFGAARVDRSGVKFDRLGKTESGQPIFAVDDATAREIRATFVIDLALVRSFGREDGGRQLGLDEEQKAFLVALALWKVERLLAAPFRFRSGCHLRVVSLKSGESEVAIDANIRNAIAAAGFQEPRVTDVYWPREDLYREEAQPPGDRGDADQDDDEGDDREGQDGE